MCATDELRKGLADAGCEFRTEGDFRITAWRHGGLDAVFFEDLATFDTRFELRSGDGTFGMLVSPQQALDATLGRGTCFSDNEPVRLHNDRFHVFRCSECHNKVNLCINPMPKYCPECGRKVVE